jgi:ABC-type nitrate/sulfonate/bicarbonate transport system substrate-binding protein
MRRSTFVRAAAATAAIPSRVFAQSLLPVRFAVLPGEAAAEPYYGSELGFFSRAGIEAQITEVSNGAAAAAVIGGSLDVGFSNPLSIAQAHERGVPITVLCAAAETHAGKSTNTILAVAKTSAIRSGKDLTGKTIACDGIGGLPTIAIRTWIDKNGGDSSTIKFVELPYSEMISGLNSGRIDAAGINTSYDPLLGKPNDPVRLLGGAYDAIAARFSSSVWFATTDWIAKNPDLARRLAATIKQIAQWANTHPHDSAVIVAEHTKQRLADVESATRVIYGTEMTIDLLQPVIDVGAKYGSLKAPFPARDMISLIALK